jgi:esterase/lipase superfamily enzyme
MHIMIYGQGGMPILSFPTQDSQCNNYEDFGMIAELADFIDGGRIQLFVVDTVDAESWSPKGGDKEWRAARQEQYFHYITEEAVPFIRSRNAQTPAVIGFSMGADHAVITFLRRPDLFCGVIALSGVYDADYFFDGWMNPTLYNNAPERFLPNMPADHPYIRLYNERRMILCCGQGAWEEDGVRTLRHLERVFREKGIHAWCDFWGYDVSHDWPWWFRQMRYFLPFLLGDK